MQNLALAAVAVFLLNLPFGYWRAGEQKFTLRWFFAIHAPVPVVVAIRFIAGLGFSLATFPALVTAFFTGQFVGSRVRNWLDPVSPDLLG